MFRRSPLSTFARDQVRRHGHGNPRHPVRKGSRGNEEPARPTEVRAQRPGPKRVKQQGHRHQESARQAPSLAG